MQCLRDRSYFSILNCYSSFHLRLGGMLKLWTQPDDSRTVEKEASSGVLLKSVKLNPQSRLWREEKLSGAWTIPLGVGTTRLKPRRIQWECEDCLKIVVIYN